MSIARLMQMAAAGAAEPTDPFFNQTVLLLHGDGTNGAQNNTFLDSSTNNFTITRNGNTTQGTFSPFSLPNGEFSNYFNAPTSADGVVFPVDVALQPGTSDFAIEFWVYMNSVSSDVTFVSRANTGSFYDLLIQFRPSVSQNLKVNTTPNSYAPYDFAWTPSANTWYHIAVTRSGTNLRAFVDGTQIGSTQTDSQNMNQSVNFAVGFNRQIPGQNLGGYLSNLRFVKGSAVYTANFSVPTSPLTAIANTQLLTCQSNRFVDNSSNGFAATTTGTPSVQPFSPFLPSAAYDPSVNGGSAYMGITSENLVTPTNTAFQLGSGNFTIEWWYYWTQERNPAYLFRTDNGVAISGLMLYYNGSNFVAYGSTNGSSWDIWNGDTVASFSRMQNRWVHLALVRNGTSFKWYVDGVSVTTGTVTSSAINQTANLFTINQFDGQGGYWSNFRYVKGTAVYTSDFTPPTAPITAVSGTELLLNFTNAGIFDNTGKNNLVTFGNAQIDTTTKKYGTGSMEFDGTGDWLLMPNTPDQQLGTGNFTIEFWVYLASGDTGSNRGLVAKGTSTTGFLVSLNTTEKVVFTYATSTITSSGAITTNAWNHIAVVREGTGSNQTKIYIGGTNDGTGTVSTDFNQTSVMYVGANRTGGDPMKGFIDDLRITKGIARYTANFTPPSQAFPNL